MKKKCGVFVLILLMVTTSTPFYGMTPKVTEWYGVDATGAVPANAESSLVVEKEVLTLDILEFPLKNYEELSEYLAYQGSVTAEYTIYNPTDCVVTEKIRLPYGQLPDYAHGYAGDIQDYLSNRDGEKHKVTVNGKEIPTGERYTYSAKDGALEDSFYTPDMPVYCLNYQVHNVRGYDETATIDWNGNCTETKIILEDLNRVYTEDSHTHIGVLAKHKTSIKVWLIGEYAKLPEWIVYKDGTCDEFGDGMVTPDAEKPIETMTLWDYIMLDYNSASGISESDWYHAKIQHLLASELEYGVIELGRIEDFERNLNGFFEYEITLQPGERIVNTVTAPIYPDRYERFKPEIYKYTYLSSLARAWGGCQTLEIHINTPFYVTETILPECEKTEQGYHWIVNELPEENLTVTLCKKADPRPESEWDIFLDSLPFFAVLLFMLIVACMDIVWRAVVVLGLIIIIFLFVLPVPPALVIGIIHLMKRKRKKNS